MINIKTKERLFFVILSLLTVLLHSNHPLNMDEGFVLAGAWDLVNGRHPYTDFFSYIPPGSYYIIYWIWSLLTPSYALAKGLAIVFMLASTYGIFRTARLFTATDKAFIPPTLFILSSVHWPIINHHIFSLLFMVWGIYHFLCAGRAEERKHYILSGLNLGIANLFLLHKGLLLAGFFFAYLILRAFVKHDRRGIEASTLFLIALITPTLLPLLYWQPERLFSDLILFPVQHYLQINASIGNYVLLFFAWFALFLVHYLLGAKPHEHIKRLLLAQYALLLTSLQLPDFFHIIVVTYPMYILYATLKETASPLRSKILTSSACVTASLVLLLLIGRQWVYLPTPFTMRQTAPVIERIKTLCPDGAYIYAGPFLSAIYFETRRLNPTRHQVLLTDFNTRAQFSEVITDLQRHPPECVVLNYTIVKKYDYQRDNVVDHYLSEHYTLQEKVADLDVLKRR